MPKQTSVTLERFHEEARGAVEPLEDRLIQHSFDTEIKASESDERTMGFVISTASVDRMGDTIAVDGWKLDNYRKNPVVLWGHDADSLPLGKAARVWIEDNKLKADVAFTPKGMARFNDTVFDMLKGKFLNATSVGFAPLKYAFTDDPQRRFGIDFMEQELLEFSIVSVPANPEALVDARSAGIDVEPLVDWHADQIIKASAGEKIRTLVEQLAAKCGSAVVSRERLQKIERAATAQRIAERNKRRARELEIVRLRSI